jgi:AAA+ ATPase superfamily predicted ATPase
VVNDAIFNWPMVEHFLDREAESARLEQWWATAERMPINLYGRRRVGKSWLFRRFAHGKAAVLLIAHRMSPGVQLASFADKLEPVLDVRPDLPDVATLIRVLYRAARDRKLLVVIDEFPWLLPGTETGDERVLSEIQAVIEEERDISQLKLVLCGSQVGQMEALNAERSPLHGRLIPVQLRPLPYEQAALFLTTLPPMDRFERFAITGGMPRYLSELGSGQIRDTISERILDRDGPLWDEARTVLEQELRESRSYFSIVSVLATGDKEQREIATATRLSNSVVSKYLQVLSNLRIVRRRTPIGSGPDSRSGRWRLEDPFFRFWFRFVFPYQDELESGLAARHLYDAEVAPALTDHVAPAFEDWCREWTRNTFGATASRVDAWWGPALNEFRRTKERSTEEIDIVGMSRGKVTVIGEVKWRNRAIDANILADIGRYKIPAMRQAGLRISRDYKTLIFAKGGYTNSIAQASAESNGRILLLDANTILDS